MVRDGYLFAAIPGVLAAASFALGWPYAGGVALLLAAFVLYFFRDPARVIPPEEGLIVSPADGRIVELSEQELEGIPRKKISIFLSLFDVHVNRAPIAGVIQALNYRPGKFLVAFKPEASSQNEQNVFTVVGENTSVTFAQIAGVLARRIVCWKRAGDELARGERVGMIRFGSRVDVFLDPKCELLVARGERVKGGSSILARLR